jgi:hypothetical protein
LSKEPEPTHPWAKFRATPSTPRPPAAFRPPALKPLPRALAPRPLAPAAAPVNAKPPMPAFPKPRAITAVLPVEPANPAASEAPATNWAAPRPSTHFPLSELETDDAIADPRARDPQERTIPPFAISDEFAAEFEKVAAADAEIIARRQRRAQRAEWWRAWRKTSSFKVLLTFVVLYAGLAILRKPSDTALEQSRHAEEQRVLQTFLKSYTAAGGTVLAEKPHGGSELYPRGVLLQGEMLDAFRRAAIGSTFTVQVQDPMWNPIAGFYGYPPIFVGGNYFHLDRRFNLALYRCTFLLRKDSEQAGAILMAKAELAF